MVVLFLQDFTKRTEKCWCSEGENIICVCMTNRCQIVDDKHNHDSFGVFEQKKDRILSFYSRENRVGLFLWRCTSCSDGSGGLKPDKNVFYKEISCC